jgi:hypothetical protein
MKKAQERKVTHRKTERIERFTLWNTQMKRNERAKKKITNATRCSDTGLSNSGRF